MHEIHVACPCCKNKRLFDANPEETVGIIKIKCPLCKSVIAVSFLNQIVRTERIATRRDGSIDVKGRSGIRLKALVFRHFSALGSFEQAETVIALR